MMNKKKLGLQPYPHSAQLLMLGAILRNSRKVGHNKQKGLREGSDIGQLVNCQIKNIKSTSWPYQGGGQRGQRGAGCNPVFLFIKSVSH